MRLADIGEPPRRYSKPGTGSQLCRLLFNLGQRSYVQRPDVLTLSIIFLAGSAWEMAIRPGSSSTYAYKLHYPRSS
jgi:hypothetical protein